MLTGLSFVSIVIALGYVMGYRTHAQTLTEDARILLPFSELTLASWDFTVAGTASVPLRRLNNASSFRVGGTTCHLCVSWFMRFWLIRILV